MLDSEENHVLFTSDLEAFVDRVSTSPVVSSDSSVGSIDLGYSTIASVLPASKMGVC